MGTFVNNKTKLIVVKSNGNSGKTTTIWMIFLELVKQNAIVKFFGTTCLGSKLAYPTVLPASANRFDFVADVMFKNKRVVLVSMGDVAADVDTELQKILPTNPDFVICASRSQNRAGSTWELFVTKYTNLIYDRVCFWSEYAIHQLDEERVKQPTVNAIIKYIS